MHYLRTEVNGGIYYGLPWQGYALRLRGNAGYISGWNGDDVRINDMIAAAASFRRGLRRRRPRAATAAA